jgi:hypothetical protein
MLKTLDVLLIVLMLGAAAWTFGNKYQVETLESQVMALDRKIALERETIQLLEADWSLLNQPRRMEQLAEAFTADLQLVPIAPEQIVRPDELPSAPLPPEPEKDAKSRTLADASKERAR